MSVITRTSSFLHRYRWLHLEIPAAALNGLFVHGTKLSASAGNDQAEALAPDWPEASQSAKAADAMVVAGKLSANRKASGQSEEFFPRDWVQPRQ